MDDIDVLMNDPDVDFEQEYPLTLTVDQNTLYDPLYRNYSSSIPLEHVLKYPQLLSWIAAISKHPFSLCFSDQESSISNEISPNLLVVTSL